MNKSHSLLILVILFFLAGCSPNAAGHAAHGQSSTDANGDKLETTSGPEQLPSFLASVDPTIRSLYTQVAKNEQTVSNMACFCGCADMGHKSNRDCFIKEKKADGSITWNSHAVTCENCQNIATESIYMRNQEGKSLLEIRKAIDKKYQEGYSKPTETPMPAK